MAIHALETENFIRWGPRENLKIEKGVTVKVVHVFNFAKTGRAATSLLVGSLKKPFFIYTEP